jgi:PAS domain S-box-containing protein
MAGWRKVDLKAQVERLKATQEELQRSLDKYQELYNSVPVSFFTVGKDYSILEANATAANLLKTTAKALLKSKFTKFIVPDQQSQDTFRACIRKISHSVSEHECELELQQSGGGRFFAHLFIVPKGSISEQNYQFRIIVRDITEEKKAEKAFQESETRLRQTQVNANIGMWDWNMVTGEIHWSEQLERMYGLPPGSVKTYQDWRQLVHPDDIGRLETERDRLIAQHQPYNLEYRILHQSGEIRWINVKGTAFYSTEGQPLSITGINIDITERKKAEDALRESEARFRSVLDNSRDFIYRVNLQTNRFDYVSPSSEEITGFSPDEFMTMDVPMVQRMVHPDDLSGLRAAIASLRETKQAEVVYRQLNKKGDYIWFSNHMSLIEDKYGHPLYRAGNIRDITERKNIEEALAGAKEGLEIKVKERTQALAESEEKYRLLVENANEAVMVFQDQLVRFFNTKATELFGYSKEEMSCRPLETLIEMNDRNLIMARHVKRIRGANVPSSYEFRIIRKDGKVRWVFLNAVLIMWEGKPAVLGLITDITERKNMEETLKSYAQKITQVQEEERKRIAFELHDDTAQYLAILKLQLDSLINSGTIQDPAILEKLRYLEKDAGRAVDDVRRYSHELRPGVLEHLGLRAALEQIAEDINKLNYFKIEIEVEGKEPKLTEDVKLGFFRIAQEAINNIRKHAKASQGIISLQFRNNRVRMRVIDNGIGFDARESFSRSKGKGSLGLMSMEERAKLIEADLKIESKPGKGTIVGLEKRV